MKILNHQKENNMTPKEYLKEVGLIELTDDNISFDCDLSWDRLTDLMFAYAEHVRSEFEKEQEEMLGHDTDY